MRQIVFNLVVLDCYVLAHDWRFFYEE